MKPSAPFRGVMQKPPDWNETGQPQTVCSMCARKAAHEALQQQRKVEQTPAFRLTYALRAGIESTFSQGVRAMGLRRSRYDGLVRTHVQQILTAVAINLVRIDAVLTHTDRGTTRHFHFARLASHPTCIRALWHDLCDSQSHSSTGSCKGAANPQMVFERTQ